MLVSCNISYYFSLQFPKRSSVNRSALVLHHLEDQQDLLLVVMAVSKVHLGRASSLLSLKFPVGSGVSSEWLIGKEERKYRARNFRLSGSDEGRRSSPRNPATESLV